VPPGAGQEDRELFATVDDVEVCDVDPVTELSPMLPRPVVPRLVVPRPLVPRPAMPRPAGSSAEFAVAVIEVPELDEDEEDDEVAVAPELLGELMTSELLTELHGTDVLVPAPTVLGNPAVGELVETLIPPPSNVGSAAVPGFPVEQGAALTAPG
jgi:hypothetical protein